MGYFDGNTVTAMWNYAQNFALNDNNFGTQFGPSSPGAVNLISGQTNGIVEATVLNAPEQRSGGGRTGRLHDDRRCRDRSTIPARKSTSFNAGTVGENVGDLLNTAGADLGLVSGRVQSQPW